MSTFIASAVVGAAAGAWALLAVASGVVWYWAGKVDEYLEPLGAVAECEFGDEEGK